jgi:hypothetical protein
MQEPAKFSYLFNEVSLGNIENFKRKFLYFNFKSINLLDSSVFLRFLLLLQIVFLTNSVPGNDGVCFVRTHMYST